MVNEDGNGRDHRGMSTHISVHDPRREGEEITVFIQLSYTYVDHSFSPCDSTTLIISIL